MKQKIDFRSALSRAKGSKEPEGHEHSSSSREGFGGLDAIAALPVETQLRNRTLSHPHQSFMRLLDGRIIELTHRYFVPNELAELKVSDENMRQWQSLTAVEVGDLLESVREHGVLQPVLMLRTKDDKFEIIDGSRRLLAAKLVGQGLMAKIIDADVEKRDVLELSMVMNQYKTPSFFERGLTLIALAGSDEENTPSMDKLCQRYNLSKGTLVRCLTAARIPAWLYRAFPSGTRIQARTIQPLAQFYKSLSDSEREILQVLLVEQGDAPLADTEELVLAALEQLCQVQERGGEVPTVDRNQHSATTEYRIGSMLLRSSGKRKLTIQLESEDQRNALLAWLEQNQSWMQPSGD